MNNKSVLVMETPENCYKCPLHRHVNTSKRCMGNMRQYEDHSIVQSWCPLRPLPEMKEERVMYLTNKYDVDYYEDSCAVAYNDCLREILGETE